MRLILLLLNGLCFATAFTTLPGSASRGKLHHLDAIAPHLNFLGRFRKKKGIQQNPMVRLGDLLPKDADIVRAADGEAVSLLEVLGTGKALLVGMPGAFTPTCTKQHLPGYVESAERFAKLGYSTIACLTTNDRFVSDNWAQVVGIAKKEVSSPSIVGIYCDGDGDVVKALGLAEDMGFGLGVRSKRFALALENGKVTHLLTDEGLEECAATSASNMLDLLTPESLREVSKPDSSTLLLGAAWAAIVALAAMQFGASDVPN
jgi:peroxiredoxin